MAQITYVNKEYLYENGDIPAKNKVQDTDMNEIKSVVNSNETKELLAVTDTAPAQCSTGDMYFNTSTKKIYTATATDTWGTTGVNPTRNTIYLEFTTQTAYAYDGTTLVSVGGGSGSSDIVIVDPDTPTAETKLYIESTDLDFQGEIVDDIYSTSEIKTNKIWIDGKPIYRKVISSTLNGTYTESGNRYTWIDSSLSNVNILKIDFIATLSDRYLINIDSTLIANVSYILTGANANKIQVGSNVSGVAINTPIYLILEYTKSN